MEIDFDELDAQLEKQRPKRNKIALDNAIINSEVAARIAKGEPILDIAKDIGVSEQTIRRRIKNLSMEELIDIENRRVMLHLQGRDLAKEKYLSLSTAVVGWMNALARKKENEMARENRIISPTFVEEINILLQRPESEIEGIRHMGEAERITEEGIPEIPEELESGRSPESNGSDDSGGEEQEC